MTKRKLFVVTEWPLREGFERDILVRALLREGIYESQITWLSLLEMRPYAGLIFKAGATAISNGKANIQAALSTCGDPLVLSLGDTLSEFLTGNKGIDKWQSSVIRSGGLTVIPCYSTERVTRDLSLQLWVALCAKKLAKELKGDNHVRPRTFLLNPPMDETLAYLRDRVRVAERVSVDIETGRGQINTIGFAISPTEAVAINVLPDRMGSHQHYELWRLIAEILQSDQPKILQNFIYETLFFSRYGIALRNVAHDTMICQKFLWPEFEMGLDAVGRMYSEMPYWKDDGKSWNNIRDWERHYEYNCKDTTGTYEGFLGQVADLQLRGLEDLHSRYLVKLFPAVTEMCSRGIPLSTQALTELRAEVSGEYENILTALKSEDGAADLNPRSPTQVKTFLREKGYAIPKKYDSATKSYKESTDEKSLKKLRMKYPQDASLSHLLRLSKLGKAHSSYLNFKYDADNRMRFSLTAGGTETMRMAGHCDPWDNGVNPQTVPGGNKGINIKSLFHAEPGHTFFQVDLRQAESRFVAYDAADANLIGALEDPSRDIHSEVAWEILLALGGDPADREDPKKWKKSWRQLGKKSGHGANYDMKEQTFIESCIQDMDLVLTRNDANKVLEAYHKLFPGIRRWHANIRRELGQTRMLKTPWGWERHFFGRLDEDMYRQAYAFRPQSTIPYVTNLLMLHLLACRERGEVKFRLLLQCHDSLLLEVPVETGCDYVGLLAQICEETKRWQPGFCLPGGRLIIPTECEVGSCWGKLEKYEGESHVVGSAAK